MSLRNLPYITLYVKDILTDEKLIHCSAQAYGVYLVLMCILTKSDPYGTFLLKKKELNNLDKIRCFSVKLSKQMPFSEQVIYEGITELFEHDVIQIRGKTLSQKRMLKDDKLSQQRALSGSKGGKKTAQYFAVANAVANTKAKSQAKGVANSGIAIGIEDGIEDNLKKEVQGKKTLAQIKQKFIQGVRLLSENYTAGMVDDFCEYWTELNPSKTKMRFQGEDYFDVPKRLATWKKHELKFSKIEYGNSDSKKGERIGRTSVESLQNTANYVRDNPTNPLMDEGY